MVYAVPRKISVIFVEPLTGHRANASHDVKELTRIPSLIVLLFDKGTRLSSELNP